jgi:hypothetical protein
LGAAQKEAFDRIKEYLVKPPLLRAPAAGGTFILYVSAQQDDGKESIVAYASKRLLDAETRHAYVEKLCLPLYYAYSMF